MTNPYDRAAAKRRLPADNWLGRRMQGIREQQGSLDAVFEAIGRIGTLCLNGRISTDLVFEDKQHFDSTSPSQELRRVSIGIIPTGMPKHQGEHGTWTQNSAMGISVDLKDAYNYAQPGRPQPLGIVSLIIGVHTWGKLSDSDEADIASVAGTYSTYGDQGFSRRGTYVQVRREPGQEMTPTDLDIIFAPLAQHIVDYPDIMGCRPYVSSQPAGNFSDQGAARYEGQPASASEQTTVLSGLFVPPPELTQY